MRIILKTILILILLTIPSFAQRSLNVLKSTQSLSAGSQIDCSGPRIGGGTVVTAKVAGNGGAVDLTSNPQILTAGRTAGDICYLLGTSDTNTVKIDNGAGVFLSSSITLANNNLEQFVFDGTNWIHTPSALGGGGAVSSVFGRTGAVTAATSDYDAVQVDNTAAGTISAANVQAALDELDTEKVPSTRTVSSTAPIEGGGDLGANRTLSLSINNLTDKPAPSTSDRIMLQQTTGEFRRADIGNLPIPTVDLDDLSDVVISTPATDEVLKFNGTNWVNGTDATGGGGSSPALDLGDNGVNESSGLAEIATTGDTNSVFTEPSADKLLIDLTKDWPKADDADQVTCTGCVADSEIASTFAKESFKTWDAPTGTDPIADTAADTITLAAGLGLSIAGDSTADSLTHAFNYGLTLAGNAAMGANECVFSSEGAGGGILCEGSVADNFEGLFEVPDVTGADSTRTITLVPASFTSGNCVEFDANGQPADAGSACGSASGTSVILDLGDNGVNESTAITEIATTGDTNSIFTEPSADKLLIDLTKDWPKADDADQVTCTGCVADAELATDFISETELDTLAELNTQITDADIASLDGTQSLTNKTIDGNAPNTIQVRRHATDCTSLTGKSGEACYEQDADTWYVCEPTAGDCDTAGEWKLINANNAVTAATATTANAGDSATSFFSTGTLEDARLSSQVMLKKGQTLVRLNPTSYLAPASNYATLNTRDATTPIPVLNFDTTTSECALWEFVMPTSYSGNGTTVEIWTIAPTAISGTVQWDVYWERVETTQDMDAVNTGFASAQSSSATSVSGTSGIPIKQTVAFTDGAQMDSCAAGEFCILKACRNVADTLAEDASMVMADIKETP